MRHLLDVHKPEFAAIVAKKQTFVVVKSTRPYKIGDTIIFQETGDNDKPTGQESILEITHLYQADGLKTGWIVLGFAHPPAEIVGKEKGPE